MSFIGKVQLISVIENFGVATLICISQFIITSKEQVPLLVCHGKALLFQTAQDSCLVSTTLTDIVLWVTCIVYSRWLT